MTFKAVEDAHALALDELERKAIAAFPYKGPYFTPQVWATIPMAKKEEWWRLTEYGTRPPSLSLVAWMVQP
jgi:hypothetical protein